MDSVSEGLGAKKGETCGTALGAVVNTGCREGQLGESQAPNGHFR